MSFMSPFLLLGAAGIALPIIAHILNNHKFQHTDWAAMRFLNTAAKVKSREIRIKDILLLILRCLAILMLALVISRPLVDEESSVLSSFGERRAGVIIALDASYSMLHKDGAISRFDRAKEKVKRMVANLTPGDPITFLLLGMEHRIVLRNRAFHSDTFLEVLEEQVAHPEALDLDSVPRRLRELVDEMDAPQKEVYIVTDVQEQDWKLGASRLKYALKDLGDSAKLVMVPVSGSHENLSITKFEFVSGVLRKDTSARYSVTVNNFGNQPAVGVKVSGKINNITVDQQMIPRIAPGSAETVSLFLSFQNPGPARISAHIQDDDLPLDNIRRAVAIIRDRVSILCVDGDGGQTFLSSALLAREGGVEEKDYSVTTIPWVNFPAHDLSLYDVVVMAGVPTITEDQTKKLDLFVRKGNGLVWLPGEKTKWKSWNERAKLGESSLLPAELEGVIKTGGAMGVGRPLSLDIPEHSVSNPLRSLSEDLLSEARFLKVYQVNPSPNSTTLLKLAGNAYPLLLEHSHGRGQVFMFTSLAGTEWNNMALTPLFPMLLQQMVTYLTSREFEKPRLVGNSLKLSYVEEPDVIEAVFESPSGDSLTVPVHSHRNQHAAILGQADEVGFYLAMGTLQSPALPIAVNVDTSESMVKCLSAESYDETFSNTGVKIASSDDELEASIMDSRSKISLWKFFGILGCLIMLIEGILCCRLPKGKREVPVTKGA